jgi:hypothetical protein
MCVAVEPVSCVFTTQFRGDFMYTNQPPLKTGKYKDDLSCTTLRYSLITSTTKYIV